MEFFLFTKDLDLALRAESAGIDNIVVDWESRGKSQRQHGHNLEINADTTENLCSLAKVLRIPITTRLNSLSNNTPREVDLALENGSKILMLPMAKTSKDAETFLDIVDGRAKTIIQIETPSLVNEISTFNSLDWDYAYIGLNDLMVASGRHSIWEAIADGTAERICKNLKGRLFGFGGSTILGGGEPILNVLIIHELVRLGGKMTILRRTFKNELLDRDLKLEIDSLRKFIECSERRGQRAIAFDHEHLMRIINLSV